MNSMVIFHSYVSLPEGSFALVFLTFLHFASHIHFKEPVARIGGHFRNLGHLWPKICYSTSILGSIF